MIPPNPDLSALSASIPLPKNTSLSVVADILSISDLAKYPVALELRMTMGQMVQVNEYSIQILSLLFSQRIVYNMP